jgi:aspartate kinase
MGLVVQKYGGTSVANVERIRDVARRVVRTRERGNQVVVVVSAMGDTTEQLLKLAHEVSDCPGDRELDMLLSTGEIVSSALLGMAIRSMGHRSISLSGFQAGIQTDAAHSRAVIRSIDPQRILGRMDEGNIVIVAGFQGATEGMEITTLGRGGSDTTAVALAASLDAQICEIYTDVEGIYTADPRLVPEARKLREVEYEEMLELATQGAKVMHPRAVELGQVYDMPISVASSFADAPGTIICGGVSMEIRNKVRGIAHDLNVAKVTVSGVPDRPGIAMSIFEPLAEADVNVDTIVQNASVSGVTDLTFTVSQGDLDKAMGIVESVSGSIGAKGYLSASDLGSVSIVGTGMQNAPGYAARMFRTLSEAGINIELITTSQIRVTCIMARDRVSDAVNALHKAFELDKGED